MTTTPLPAITKQFKVTLRRDGSPLRRECWSARTVDGVWAIERIEDVGTPWVVLHNPTGLVCGEWHGTLKSALKSIANGNAERALIGRALSHLLTGHPDRWGLERALRFRTRAA